MADERQAGSYSASDFRDSHKQSQYRKQSQSEGKDTQEVGHTVSLDVAAEVLNKYGPPGKRPQSDAGDVKRVLNDFSNLGMVDSETNMDQAKTDESLKEKAVTGETLTAKEEKRAVQGAKVIQEHKDELGETAQAFENFYQNLKTKSGENAWDCAKDKDKK